MKSTLALVIYVYDSFFSGAPREELAKKIQARSGHPVEWVIVGDSAQLISRYQLDRERKKPRAHLLIGVDQTTFPELEEHLSPITEKELPTLTKLKKILRFSEKFVPYNEGVLSLVVDSTGFPEKFWPMKWEDLLKPELKKKLILEDPRTSTPGLGFLLGSRLIFGDRFSDFWKKLRTQWLTLAPGWSQAYGLFTKREAPMVWSYTTSQAYHQMREGPMGRYRAVVFEEGNPIQSEGAVIPDDAPGGAEMRKATFGALEVLLSEDTQRAIPEAQWMFPAREGIQLPWDHVKPPVPEPKKRLNTRMTRVEIRKTLKLWSDAIQ